MKMDHTLSFCKTFPADGLPFFLGVVVAGSLTNGPYSFWLGFPNTKTLQLTLQPEVGMDAENPWDLKTCTRMWPLTFL